MLNEGLNKVRKAQNVRRSVEETVSHLVHKSASDPETNLFIRFSLSSVFSLLHHGTDQGEFTDQH